MPEMTEAGLTDAVRKAAQPLSGSVGDYDALIGWAADAPPAARPIAPSATTPVMTARAAPDFIVFPLPYLSTRPPSSGRDSRPAIRSEGRTLAPDTAAAGFPANS